MNFLLFLNHKKTTTLYHYSDTTLPFFAGANIQTPFSNHQNNLNVFEGFFINSLLRG